MDGFDGYLQRTKDCRFEGEISIRNVNLSPIEGVYFKEGEKQYLWLKRKAILEYDEEEMKYKPRAREPRWEAYLEKQKGGVPAYKGEFFFLRMKYTISGIWDIVLGMENNRMNFLVEQCPMKEQTIVNRINERKREQQGKQV